jgi:hypothetical protein
VLALLLSSSEYEIATFDSLNPGNQLELSPTLKGEEDDGGVWDDGGTESVRAEVSGDSDDEAERGAFDDEAGPGNSDGFLAGRSPVDWLRFWLYSDLSVSLSTLRIASIWPRSGPEGRTDCFVPRELGGLDPFSAIDARLNTAG